MLAQRKYKSSHGSVVKAVHWCLCRKYGLTVAGKWYEHVPEKVRESGKSKSFGILFFFFFFFFLFALLNPIITILNTAYTAYIIYNIHTILTILTILIAYIANNTTVFKHYYISYASSTQLHQKKLI